MAKRKRMAIIITIATLLIGAVFAYQHYTDVEADTVDNTAATQSKEEKNSGNMDSNSASEKQNDVLTDDSNQNEGKDSEKTDKPSDSRQDSSSSSEKKGHYEIIPAYDETVLIREAYDEQILVSKGECTEVKISDAWDEEIWEDGAWYGSDTLEAKVCNGCGAIFYGSISEHMADNPEHGGWHNELIPQCDPYWHGNRTIIHHDAVYETRCEPDEYTTVHHDPEYKTIHHEEQRIWVDD